VSGPEWWSLTLLGEAPRGRTWTRRGARAGDLVCVTGSPGRAGAGLLLARALGERARAPEWRPLLDAWLRPRAPIRLAAALGRLDAVTAAIDLSDGFAGDLRQMCEASGVGAEVEESSWPGDAALESAAQALGLSLERLRHGPSDDYELLLAIDPAHRASCESFAREAGSRLAVVGRFTEAPGLVMRATEGGATRPLTVASFDHFAGS
jgi:thiamine-monophosphate kinase